MMLNPFSLFKSKKSTPRIESVDSSENWVKFHIEEIKFIRDGQDRLKNLKYDQNAILFLLSDEIEVYLRKNFKFDEYRIEYVQRGFFREPKYICFKNEEDAMAFKLEWL